VFLLGIENHLLVLIDKTGQQNNGLPLRVWPPFDLARASTQSRAQQNHQMLIGEVFHATGAPTVVLLQIVRLQEFEHVVSPLIIVLVLQLMVRMEHMSVIMVSSPT
tara:strand:- start:171 stop:488 length:318 start_codon:yes stop_codon:yes gene_type:complete